MCGDVLCVCLCVGERRMDGVPVLVCVWRENRWKGKDTMITGRRRRRKKDGKRREMNMRKFEGEK